MEKERKKKKGTKRQKTNKEEISEIFEVESRKAGETASLSGKQPEERIIKTHKIIEEKEKTPSKEQIKRETKIFRNIVILMMGFIFMFFIVYFIIYLTNHFEVEGIKFEIVKIGQLTLYKTSVPGIIKDGKFFMGIYETGQKAEYTFYFRKDPRQLENIPIDGRVTQIKKFNVINSTDSFNCNGDGIIAIQNLIRWYEVVGGSIIKDANASCDSKGTYGWIQIQEGNKTSIERFGPSCFNLYVNNCEILDATEKFMLESLIELHKKTGI